jgi:hypothetical protein
MRLSANWIVPFAPVVLGVACNTVSPEDCWLNTSGGLGGAEPIPLGVGAGVANPCVEPLTGCGQGCESDYTAAALQCGKIADNAQRKTCQDGAYTVYKNCLESCQQKAAGKPRDP